MERTGYTIRIFVADGDPEGLRVIDQMNWTGKGIIFPRALCFRAFERAILSNFGANARLRPDHRQLVYFTGV